MKLFYLLVLLISSTDCSSIRFLSRPVDKIVSPQQSTSINCTVSGSTTISWFKSSIPLLAGTKYSFTSNGSVLVIADFTSADNGEYYCVASNDNGSVRSLSFHLSAATINPISTSQSQTIAINENSPLTLNCTLPSSTPPPSVKWYRGANLVQLSNRVTVTQSGSLVFSYTLSSDQGPYRCDVMNDLISGSTATSINYLVSINAPSVSNPSISLISDPLPQTLTVGMQARFECYATGRPLPSYSWSKNGTAVLSSQKIAFTKNSRVLTINNISLSDAGHYKCIISQNGIQMERSTSLTVIDTPRIVSSFGSVVQYASLSINVSCSAEANTPIKWIWRRNNVHLRQSTNIEFTETGPISTLTINSLNFNGSGILQCVAYTDNYRNQSASNNDLIVQTLSPDITSHPKDTLAFVGNAIVLPCEAVSYPFPTFSWLRNDAKLILTNRYTVPSQAFNGTLTIQSATVDDTANYKCAVESIPEDIVVVSNIAIVRVINLPQIERPPNNMIAQGEENVIVHCSVSDIANTDISYIWSKDGSTLNTINPKLTIFSNGSLLINNFDPTSDAGKYTCTVMVTAQGSNADPLSHVIGHAFITSAPPTPPSPPRNPMILTTTYNSSSITWTVPIDNGSLPISHYVLQLTTVTNNNSVDTFNVTSQLTTFTVSSLEPFTSYTVQVYAVNSNGTSIASQSIMFTTKETFPSSSPLSVSVTGDSEIGLLVIAWDHPPKEGRNGIIVSYTVRITSKYNSRTVTTSNNDTNISVHNLLTLTNYSIQIAASTTIGIGPFSNPVWSITSLANPPNPPLNITSEILNCSLLVRLSWRVPPPQGTDPVNNLTVPSIYRITYNGINYTTTNTYYILSGLTEGSTNIITLYSINHFGISVGANKTVHVVSNCVSTNGTMATPTGDVLLFYQQSWFVYAAAGGGGGLLVFLVLIIFLCCICCLCCKKHRSKDPSTPSPNRFHFTDTNRRSTVLDRMMQVEALPPGSSPAEYAELSTLTGIVPSPMSNSGTLTSQSSTLKSKYQYKSPMEQEEDRLKNGGVQAEESTDNNEQDHVLQDHTLPSTINSQRRLFTNANNLQVRNPLQRQGSASPTDTVSSFEYESHSQIMQKLNRLRSSEELTDEGYYSNNKLLKNGSSSGNIRKPPPTFRKLPDLALMTSIPSGKNSPSYPQMTPERLPSLINDANTQKHNGQYHTNEHIYQQPKRAVANKYTYTLPSNISSNTQMSLV